MPWSYRLDRERNAVLVKASGALTDDDLILGLNEVGREPGYAPDSRFFLDYAGVTNLQLSGRTILDAARARAFSAGTRRAFLVADIQFAAALTMVQPDALGEFKIFTSRATALAWLNRDVPPEKAVS